jgi:tetratricopeptide (TPR) repeat protein
MTFLFHGRTNPHDYQQFSDQMFVWQYDQARQIYERSIALLREMGDWPDLSTTLQGLGVLEKDVGKLTDANTHLLEALKLDRAAGNEAQVAADLSILAQMRSDEGDSTAAKKMLRECIQIFLRSGDRNSYAIMLNNLAGVYLQSGDLIPAQKLYKESIAIGKEVGDQGGSAVSMMSLGYLRLSQDDLEGARQQFEAASQIIHSINPTDWTPSVAQATLLLEEGRKSNAETLLRQAVAGLREQHDVNVEADAQTVLIRALLDQNKIAEAQNAVSEVQELVTQTATPELHLEADIAVASVLLASRKVTDATKRLQDSIEVARKHGFRGHMFPGRARARHLLTSSPRPRGCLADSKCGPIPQMPLPHSRSLPFDQTLLPGSARREPPRSGPRRWPGFRAQRL